MDGPLFRPLSHNGKATLRRRAMDPDAIDCVVRRHAATLGLPRGYSAHSMRATFIITALDNGAKLEGVQKADGHRDSSTTKLYDRRGYDPEKAAVFSQPTEEALAASCRLFAHPPEDLGLLNRVVKRIVCVTQ